MKIELKKLILRSNTMLFVYVIGILFFGTLVYGTLNMHAAGSLGDYLGTYDSQEELEQLARENQELFDENKAEYEDLGWDLEPLYERIRVFDYAISHEIAQKDAFYYPNLVLFQSRDSVGVNEMVNYAAIICILLSAGYLSVTMVAADFSGKQSRFLYAGRNRMTVLWRKFRTYLITLGGIYVFLETIGLLLGMIFSTKLQTVLFTADGKVYGMSVAVFELLEILGDIVALLPDIMVFFAIAMLTRRQEIAVILDIGWFLLTAFFSSELCYILDNDIVGAVGCCPLETVAYGFATLSQWLIAYLCEAGVVMVLFAVSARVFRRASIR